LGLKHFWADIAVGALTAVAVVIHLDVFEHGPSYLITGKVTDVKKAIDVLMLETGLTRRHLITRLKDHHDPVVSLKAVYMGLKLTDSYPAPTDALMDIDTGTGQAEWSIFSRLGYKQFGPREHSPRPGSI